MFALVAKLAVVVSVAAPSFSRGIDDQTVARWGQAGGIEHLVRSAWLEGEAAERGIVVSDEDAREAAVDPHDGLTSQQDLRYEARIKLLDAAMKEGARQAAAESVTGEQIDALLRERTLTTRASRRVRIVNARNRHRARLIEEALKRGVTWKRAGARYGPKARTRLVTYLGPPLDGLQSAIFKAREHRITRSGISVFEVVSSTPSVPLPPEQQRATAWEILASDAQTMASNEIDASIAAKWRPRTTCASPLVPLDLCGNSPTG